MCSTSSGEIAEGAMVREEGQVWSTVDDLLWSVWAGLYQQREFAVDCLRSVVCVVAVKWVDNSGDLFADCRSQ